MSLEIAKTYNGIMIAIPDENWTIFVELARGQLAELLKQRAKNVVLSKPPKTSAWTENTKQTKISEGNHVSTARLLGSRTRTG